MKIGIVLLNYNTFIWTTRCINSINKLDQDGFDIEIVIVDNNSPDKSGEQLYEKYGKQENIKVILLPENLGFSKGNNKGIMYLRRFFSPELIVLSNTDVEIQQKNFLKELSEIYINTKFAICGPDIFNPEDKSHQNPIFEKIKIDSKFVRKRLFQLRIRKLRILVEKKFRIHMLKAFQKRKKSVDVKRTLNDCVLHGSFMVISKEYLNIYEDGLYDKTFMYGEEEILYVLCKIKELKIVYTPNIQVFHFENKSTINTYSNRVESELFKQKEMVKSTKLLGKLIQGREDRL